MCSPPPGFNVLRSLSAVTASSATMTERYATAVTHSACGDWPARVSRVKPGRFDSCTHTHTPFSRLCTLGQERHTLPPAQPFAAIAPDVGTEELGNTHRPIAAPWMSHASPASSPFARCVWSPGHPLPSAGGGAQNAFSPEDRGRMRRGEGREAAGGSSPDGPPKYPSHPS